MLSEESDHIICLFKRNSSRISLLQLSVSYILRENSISEGRILDNKNFMKYQPINIFVYNIDQIVLFKTFNDFANVICICIFRKAKSVNCVEIKRKK